MHNNVYRFFILLTSVVFYHCANIKPPTGGPEDQTPPELEKTIPLQNTLNYKGNSLSFLFNENIDAQKLRENMIVSPLIESEYDVVVKKKKLTIRFKENFKENTTYNINLSDCIKDVTKGNYIPKINLAFSTGAFIDSLSIKGQANDFITAKGLGSISIELYNVSDTNNITNSRPLYYTKTDVSGNFTIQNVKEGTYKLYALNDLNNNYKYEEEKESIGYIDTVKLNQSVNNLKIGITKADTKPPKLLNQKQEYEYYVFAFNEALMSYSLKANDAKIISTLTDDKKNLRLFNTFATKDSILLHYQLTDSSGNVLKDSTKIFFEEYKNKDKKNTFKLSLLPKNNVLKKKEPIQILFNKPLGKINNSKIKIKTDTTVVDSTQTNLFTDSLRLKISTLYTFKDSLVLNFKRGSFISSNGDSSEAFSAKLKPANEENFGILGGTINCKDSLYIFQLIDSKGKVLHTQLNPTKFYYTYIEPGIYELKIIVDVNKNGRWDAINLMRNLPPEPIYTYKEKINLRANWELLDIKFEVK